VNEISLLVESVQTYPVGLVNNCEESLFSMNVTFDYFDINKKNYVFMNSTA